MKKLAIAFAVLFLPISAYSTTYTFPRGYAQFWCEDKEGVNPKDPNVVKGYCYTKAVTNADNTMTGVIHKTRSSAKMRPAVGVDVYRETGLITGSAIANLSAPYWQWEGLFTIWVQIGEVFCPKGQRTQKAGFYSRGKKLGVSTICLKRDGNPANPVRALGGPQLGWNAGYFPISPCSVKCVATHYTIYVVSPGGTIQPAPTGTAHKGWSIDVETGVVTCTGFVVSFIPDGIPGILPCATKGCKEAIVSIP